jgi:agmatine deiminase
MRYFPAEWSSQYAVLLTWPHPHGPWQAQFAKAEATFIAICQAISRYQRLIISCQDDTHLQQTRRALADAQVDNTMLAFYLCPAQDSWARDHGPITVFDNHQPLLLDFTFNGWGNKYPSALDNQITRNLHRQNAFNGYDLQSHDLVLEGGNLDSDGHGSVLISKYCQLNPNRNPQYSQTDIETLLKEQLGVQQLLWLDNGQLPGDDTDGHIDTLARFCNPYTICYNQTPATDDPRYAGLANVATTLEQFTNIHGQPYQLIPLPLPAPCLSDTGQHLPATYVNFLIINSAVLVPLYNDPSDAIALTRLQLCFPDRQIIGIDCLSLIEQGGSLHCATMQIPTLEEAVA